MLEAARGRSRTAARHINKLELRTLLTALRWRARRAPRHGQRSLHLVDSVVIVSKVNVTVLAARLRLVLAHVASAGNPADAPSRRRFGTKVANGKLKKNYYRRAGAHPAGGEGEPLGDSAVAAGTFA